MKSQNLKIIGAHFITILLWSSAFPAIRVALSAYSPEHISLLRLLIGSFCLIVLALFLRIRLPDKKDVPFILLLGFLAFAVYHVALNYGEQTVSAGIASLLVSTAPLFTALLALLFFKERFGIFGWAGAAIALTGVVFISFGNGNDLFSTRTGLLLILIAALAESFYFVFQSSFLQKYGFISFTMYTIWGGTLCMLWFLPGLGQEIGRAPLHITMTVIYLGIFPTVIPYFALAYVTMKTGAAQATASLYLTPVFAFLIAWVWLQEVPTLFQIAGGILTLIGVSISNLKTFKTNALSSVT